MFHFSSVEAIPLEDGVNKYPVEDSTSDESVARGQRVSFTSVMR